MTDKEIVKKAIEKVIENGWKDKSWGYIPEDVSGYVEWLLSTRRLNDVIFSRNFAEAL